jgi:predicted RNA-binding Zn-ribbon protein involved in translation (DUF1610 family)
MDRKIYQIAAERPCNRYWVKIFHNLLDVALRNAHEIYKQKVSASLSCQDFAAHVAESQCSSCTPAPPATTLAPVVTDHICKLLDGRKERNCVVCSDSTAGVRHRSRHWCPGCGVGVHEKCLDQLRHGSHLHKRRRTIV